MNFSSLKFSTPPAFARLAADAQRSWARLAPRERRLVSLAAAVVGVALVYLVLVEPAWNEYRRLGAQLPLLRTQAASVESLTAEARALQRTTGGKMTPAETRQALVDSLQRAGIAAQVDDAAPADGQTEGGLQVTVDQVPAATLLQWLASVPSQTRLQLAEASLGRPADDNGRLMTGKASGVMLFSPAFPNQAK